MLGDSVLHTTLSSTLSCGRYCMNDNQVLSISAETELLAKREAILKNAGYSVLSSTSEMQIRFEILMGQCGVLLLCYTLHQSVHGDLAGIFGQNCPASAIVFIMHPEMKRESRHAHVNVLDAEFGSKLHLIKSAQNRHNKSA